MNNNFVIKRGGFGGHSVFVTWPPFACRFFPFLSFPLCTQEHTIGKSISWRALCKLRTSGLGITKSSPTLHGPFVLVLLVGSIGFKIWRTWIVVGTPLSRATLQELLVFGCLLYKNCELPNMIGCSELPYATLMWKPMRSFVCLMFSSFKIFFWSII
jgi:hypothetical protein